MPKERLRCFPHQVCHERWLFLIMLCAEAGDLGNIGDMFFINTAICDAAASVDSWADAARLALPLPSGGKACQKRHHCCSVATSCRLELFQILTEQKSIQQTSADKKDDMMIRRFWKNWKGVKRFCKRMTSAEWKNTARLKRVRKSGLRNCDNILSSAFASGRPVSINLQQLRHCVFQKYKCLDAQEIIHLQ